MELTIHRGTQEVGGTMIEIKSGAARILLDAGYPLFYHGELIDDQWQKKPYGELLELGVIPKVRGLYFWDQPAFDAVLISHAHSDHFGLLRYIHPAIPVYLSAATDRLMEMNLSFPISGYRKRDRRIFPVYEPFSIGDITVKAFLMDHSAFQAAAFELCCEGKTILYTGDFRGHGRRRAYLERFLRDGSKNADLLFIEGTTLDRTGERSQTEEALEREFEAVIRKTEGAVLCQPASQNIDRVISFYNAARACGRLLVMDLYTASLMKELAHCGHGGLPVPSPLRADIRVFRPLALTKKMETLLERTRIHRFPLNGISGKNIGKMQQDIVMLVRPSMLPGLKQMKLKDGALIYSQWQVYRTKPYQLRLEEYLKARGFADYYIHTSGHAFEEDIKKVIKGLSPKEIVPIHTFRPEAFFQFHSNVTLRQDGIPFRL